MSWKLFKWCVTENFWRIVAWIVTREPVFKWLKRRSARTPYSPIWSRDGRQVYMHRYWLFNPYPGKGDERKRWGDWLPSVRLHHIVHRDDDEHLHDHPWDARTIILRGYYVEQMDDDGFVAAYREEGYTGPVKFGQYHRIGHVSDGGAWTLFITWRYMGTWGFRVNGEKVPYKVYLGIENDE